MVFQKAFIATSAATEEAAEPPIPEPKVIPFVYKHRILF